MLDLICIAYNVDPEKVSGGHNWLEMDRFDVFAKTASASNAETRRLMLQALLADRFGLKTHTGSQSMPAYALAAGKHSGLKEADSSAEPGGCKFEVQNAPTAPPTPGTPIQLPTIVYTCKNTSLATFATNMLNVPGAAQYFNNRLVVDKTELAGDWDFSFHFTPKVPPVSRPLARPHPSSTLSKSNSASNSISPPCPCRSSWSRASIASPHRIPKKP
jgi:uncharacterized protein (TIGR03435 family)